MPPKEIVLSAFMAIFGSFEPEVAQNLLAEDYKQHNLSFPNGSAPVIQAIPALKESGIKVTTHRVLQDEDLVVLHNTYDNAAMFGGDKLVAFDIFRVNDGKITEHWDNLQPWTDKTASGRSMVDGPTEITGLEKIEANRQIVMGFVTDVLHGKAPENITRYVSTEKYHQHNPMAADGLDSLGAVMQGLAEAGTPMVYTSTPIVVVEGNFAFTASEGRFGDTPTAYHDLFRIEDGLIVEHWDVVSTIPPKSEWQNDNGKF